MPRSKPVTINDIKAREKFGLGPVLASDETVCGHGKRWDFSSALDELDIRDKKARDRAAIKLLQICRMHSLAVRVEGQETPGRIAASYKKAQHEYLEATRQLERARKQRANGKEREARLIEKKAYEVLTLWPSWLPPALGMEASRLHLEKRSAGEYLTRLEILARLKAQYGTKASQGKYKNFALEQTIQRLRWFAEWENRSLKRTTRRFPKKLISFLHEALKAAGIPYPDYYNHPTKFRRLLRDRRGPFPS